jgi:predicted ATPase
MLPDHLRLRALLLLRLRPDADDEALPLLYQAIEIAHSHGASSFELRAALAAERVLGGLGRDAEGRRLVEAAYSGFTEGFDDPDLREARAILG